MNKSYIEIYPAEDEHGILTLKISNLPAENVLHLTIHLALSELANGKPFVMQVGESIQLLGAMTGSNKHGTIGTRKILPMMKPETSPGYVTTATIAGTMPTIQSIPQEATV